ncbi:MAG: hypothetical protein K5660_08590 [Paludibacteraceae bacterium]|nr:hypothetical protein [Paludibacteraceae bacterium]
MSRYKVTLKPIDWFFFGGEQTFDNGSSQSFIARSNRYPQQTSLLGMVRYQLLKQAGLLSEPGKKLTEEEKQKSAELIGSSSFSLDSQTELHYGAINGLSPVYIQRGGKILLPMPYTFGTQLVFPPEGGRICLGGNTISTIPQLTVNPGYDYYKNPERLIDVEGNISSINDLYKSTMQIGITKAQDGDDNESGFFKQEVLRFANDDISFVFYLQLADGVSLSKDTVFVGAQRSCFKMDVDIWTDELFIPSHPDHSVLICSPTFVHDIDAMNDCCLFHWSRSMPFRNIINSENGRLKSGAVAYRRHSAVSTFLQPGSVLFYKKEKLEQLVDLLNNPNLKTIGYNNYHINE